MRVTIIGYFRCSGGLRGTDGACFLSSQVAVLLQRATVLWQSASVWNHPGVRENTASLSLHRNETTTPGTSKTGKRQTATWETNSNPHSFPKVRECSCGSSFHAGARDEYAHAKACISNKIRNDKEKHLRMKEERERTLCSASFWSPLGYRTAHLAIAWIHVDRYHSSFSPASSHLGVFVWVL